MFDSLQKPLIGLRKENNEAQLGRTKRMASWHIVYVLPMLLGICALFPSLAFIEIMQKNFKTNNQFYTGVFQTSANLITFFGSPMLGKISDRIGRNVPLAITMGLQPVFMILLSYTNSMSFLLILTLGAVSSGISASFVVVIQSYIIDNSNPENKMRNLGIMYAFIALSFLLGATAGAAVGEKYGIVEAHKLPQDEYEQVVGDFTLLLRYIGLSLSAIGIMVSLCLPEPPSNSKSMDAQEERNDISLFEGINYIRTADPIIKQLALLNALRVAVYHPVTANYTTYVQVRFGKTKPPYFVTLAVMGMMGILGNLSVKYNSKRLGKTNLVVIGFLSYALADVLFGIVPKSFFPLLFVPSSFTFFSIVTNTLLDSATSGCVSSNDQGLVMGSMSQCRAITTVFLTVPAGYLFSIVDKAGAEYKEANNEEDAYFLGFPFLLFSLFGFCGACYSRHVMSSIDGDDVRSNTVNEEIYYEKLDDGADAEIEESENSAVAMMVGSRSSSFIEMM